jgi:hypothetical protein
MREDAPVIFFDILETWAVSAGIGHLDLATALVEPGTTPAKTKNVSVAHLRFPLSIVPVLKRAIEQIKLVEKPAAGKA